MPSTSNYKRCAACKYLRRGCSEDCVLAPYFPSTLPERFSCVHKIFGAGNVTRILQQLPVNRRSQAADSISYEAYCRVQDPVYGSVGIISHLQQQICERQQELARTQAEIAMHIARTQASQTQQDFHQQEEEEPFASNQNILDGEFDLYQLSDFV